MQKRLIAVLSLACLAASGGAFSGAQTDDSSQELQSSGWKSWGGNVYNTHSSFAEHRISPANVGQLREKWVFAAKGDVSATPTVEGDAVYVVDWGGGIFRLCATTGKPVWSKTLPELTSNSMSFARTSPAIAGNKIIIGDQASGTILALDKETGNVVWRKLVDPQSAAFITTSPVVSDGVAYIGVSSQEEGLGGSVLNYVFHFRGSIQALDVETGAVLWKTYTVPEGYTGGAVWGSNFVIDHRRGSLYGTVGNNYTVPAAVSACLKTADETKSKQLACLSKEDYIDSVIALDLKDGKVKWDRRLQGSDTWSDGCILSGGAPCPIPPGPDWDLGAGANLITIRRDGVDKQVLGAGQKSGMYWGLDPDNGNYIYGTQVGPGGNYGGIEWGASTDNKRVYVPLENFYHHGFFLQDGQRWNGGTWSALDAETGKFLWQTRVPGVDPHHPSSPSGALAPVSEANGVVYGGAMSGWFVAMDSATGKILWQFQSGGSVNCAPAIVDGSIYWGTGYRNDPDRLGGKGNNKVYAFALPDEDRK